MTYAFGAPRKIPVKFREETVKADLERYVRLAKDFGASDAKRIMAKDMVVDERVTMKCLVPRCHRYGNCANCPPLAPQPEEIRSLIERYRYAILVKHDVVPKEDFTDPRARGKPRIGRHHAKTTEIVSRLEVAAFNDGYYLAMAFGAGSCRTNLCKGAPCSVIGGGECRFPLMARPSMEGVGIDVFNLVSKVGWDIYPIGPRGVDPKKVPCALSIGIVFVC